MIGVCKCGASMNRQSTVCWKCAKLLYPEIPTGESLLEAIQSKDKTRIKAIEEKAKRGELVRLI